MADDIETWVTMKEVQEHIGARRETTTQWIEKQTMPACKVGTQLNFKLSKIDKWVRPGDPAHDEHPTGRTEEDDDA